MNLDKSAVQVSGITLRNDARAPTTGIATADYHHYDDYFHIDRNQDPAAWWNGAQRVARQVVNDLPGAGLDERHEADLLAGISRLLLANTFAATDSGSAVPVRAQGDDERGTAVHRWKLGHHLFHHMLSLMNSHADGITTAVTKADWVTTRALVEELTVLYGAATAAMHYAASFPVSAYEDTVRPSMEPPWMPPGFSGAFNREHATLLHVLARLKPWLRGRAAERALPGDVAVAARALWRAQSRNRREHKLICEKFVPGGGSLLQQHFDEGEKKR